MDEQKVEKVVKKFCAACWEKTFGYPPPSTIDANEHQQDVAHERKAVIRPEGEACDFCPQEAVRRALQDAPPAPAPAAEPEASEPEPSTNPEPPARASKKPPKA